MAVKAVIFDMFGTLTCTTSPEWLIIKKWGLKPGVHPALQRAVCGQKFGEWEEYLDRVVAAAGIENSSENREAVKGFVLSECERGLKNVFPETKVVLQELKARGYALALLSNAYPTCRRIIRENGLLPLFKEGAIVFSHEVGMIKQNPEIFRLCLKRLGVEPGEAVMVGDNLKDDLLGAKAATDGKIWCIFVSAIAAEEAKKAGCTVVPSLTKVPEAVEEIGRKAGG